MLDGKELRALIRDVIATEIAAVKRDAAPVKAAPAEHRVRIANDADLAAFARQVLSLAGDPATRSAIANGSYRFTLEGGAATAPMPAAPASASSRIEKGVVTETLLLKLPKGTKRLQVGAQVSVTPLARDKASSLGITIERMKP
ncbi:hypothetical protein [Dongia sp. agr-C8]